MNPLPLVWWLHTSDIFALATRFTASGLPEEFGCWSDGTEVHPADLPCAPAVYTELRDICGRPLRGRLWVPPGISIPEEPAKLPGVVDEDAGNWGGIVISDMPCLPPCSPGRLATWEGQEVEFAPWEAPPLPTRLHLGFLPLDAYLPGPPRTALPWTYNAWWKARPPGAQVGANDTILASALDDATRVVLHAPDSSRVVLAESPAWLRWSDRMDVGECAWMVLREWAPPRTEPT